MNQPSFSLKGKVAIVTGGKSGIGRAIALGLAGAGADVAVCGRVIEDGQLEGVAEEIRRFGRRSLAIRADVSRKSDVDTMVGEVADKIGAVDILVNNAGVVCRTPLLDITEAEWDDLMNIDLRGCLFCAQAAGRIMVKRQMGSIINIASQTAYKPSPGRGAYSVAKAGVVMLTRALAQEVGGYGIRVNAIAPGLVRTEFSRAAWSDPAYLEKRVSILPLRRIGEPEDIVGASIFLASDASAYMTGTTVLVDGGQLA